MLRHDVDHNGACTRKMFLFEKKIGVKSTYYFRMSTIDRELIKEMIDSGFEVGFHYESLANYADENGIRDPAQVDFNKAREYLVEDIKRFREVTGINKFSICSHGAPTNDLLKISNNMILDGIDLEQLGVIFDAYDEKMYDCIDCHIMDGRLLDNFGFAYKDNPYDAIKKGFSKIVFLTHPNHWWISFLRRIRYLLLFMIGKAKYSTNRSFERTY